MISSVINICPADIYLPLDIQNPDMIILFDSLSVKDICNHDNIIFSRFLFYDVTVTPFSATRLAMHFHKQQS